VNTVFLNPLTWGWCLDLNGNIAMAQDPYAVAQDVASACRLFLGELWYNTDAGVPYFGQILGEQPPIAYVAAQLQLAALTVPTVTVARAVITNLAVRTITGQVQFTTVDGNTQVVGF
jgi:hypothetical protein